MSKPITLYQNQWEIDYHFDKLNEDFDFYRIENLSDNFEAFSTLSAAIQFSFPQVLNAKQLKKGTTYIVVAEKSQVNEEDLKRLATYYSSVEVKIQKIPSQAVRYINGENYFFLTCLILGLLPVYSIRDGWAQIDGHTYFFMPTTESSWHKKDRIYGVGIEPEFQNQRFKIKARTFAKLNEVNREKTRQFFVRDEQQGTLKQIPILPRDNEGSYYSNKAVPKSKASIPQLDLSSIEGFEKTKTGIFYNFMKDVQQYLGAYITLRVNSMDNIDYKSAQYAHKDHRKEYIGHFSNQTIHLIDLIKSEESQEFLADFQTFVESESDYNEINFQISDKPMDGFNLAVLHKPDYYESEEAIEAGEKDPHLAMLNDQIIQHITIEDFSYSTKTGEIIKEPIIKILQELILKEVNCKLQLNKLTMRDYFQKYGPLSFAKYYEESEGCYGLYLLEISSDGKLAYKYFSPENITQRTDPLLTKLEEMRLSRESQKSSKYKNHSKVSGFVIKNLDAIAMIYETNRFTISNFERIQEILSNVKKDNADVIVGNLQRVVAAFLSENKNHPNFEIGQNFYDSLSNYGYTENVQVIKQGFDLRGRPSIMKEINNEVYKQLGYFLWSPLRTKEYEDSYANFLNINCFKEEDKNYYFVGIPKKGIKNAPIVRTTIIREFVLN